jgi:membrane protease YdiL (CAAX protease family)
VISSDCDKGWETRLQAFFDFPLVAMILAFAAIMAPVGLVAGLFERMLPSSTIAAVASQLAVAVVILASYKLFVRHLGARKRDDLSGPGALRQLGAGVGVGTSLFALIVGVAALIGTYRLHGAGDASNLLPSLVRTGLFPAIAEEVIYRAVLFRWIEEFAGSWAALFLSSLLFGLSHMDNPSADVVSTVGIMLEGGILLGGAYMLTRRLWFPMGIHASWNLTQGEIFDIPVSGNDAHGLVKGSLQGPDLLTGGGFGLEGSLISITIATAAGLAIVWLAVRRGQLVRPSWTGRPA